MRWDDSKICVILGRLDLFSRSPEVTENYDRYRSALYQNKINIEDVIENKMQGASFKWMRNAFPYDVDGTRHYVIWSVTPLSTEKIREIAFLRVGGLEFVHFVNPGELQSVKKLWHAHILVKKS